MRLRFGAGAGRDSATKQVPQGAGNYPPQTYNTRRSKPKTASGGRATCPRAHSSRCNGLHFMITIQARVGLVLMLIWDAVR